MNFSTLHSTLAHLPVREIAQDVAQAFSSGMIPVVTSAVASGKTLILPAVMSESVDKPIYVLEPTRFLSNNAMSSMHSILGEQSENLVGCLNSNRSDDPSITHKNNRIIFTTVGYALSAGIVHEATNIVFDEAHETSIDLSLAKAIVKRRLDAGEEIRTAILSATIDQDNEMDFWGDKAIHFETDGSAFPVEFHHRPAWTIGEAVRASIEEHDRKGILVFVPGKEEIQEAIDSIRNFLGKAELVEDTDFEVMGVHGSSQNEERRRASANPKTPVKILVGTNVLESGISLPWVDGGVGDGKTKVMHVTNNVHRLEVEDLPLWRIKQEMGRVCRFKPGVFILTGKVPMDLRPNMAAPDIVRLPLTELVMHCAKFENIKIFELQFSKKETPKPGALEQAIETLVNYGLIGQDEGSVFLTNDGKLIEKLPVSFQAGAAYCEAVKLDCVADMLPIVAHLDVGDVRHSYKEMIFYDGWHHSDTVHQVGGIAKMYATKADEQLNMREACEIYNLNTNRVREFVNLLSELEKKTGIRANHRCYLETDYHKRKKFEALTKQVIFRALIGNVHYFSPFSNTATPATELRNSFSMNSATLSNTSHCRGTDAYAAKLCVGTRRQITPKRGFPFTVIEMVTMFAEDDVRKLGSVFGMRHVDPQGRLNPQESETDPSRFFESGHGYNQTRERWSRDNSSTFDDTPPTPVVKAEEKKLVEGSLGALLQAAMNKK